MLKLLSLAALCMILSIKKPTTFASTSNNDTKKTIITIHPYQITEDEPLSLRM